MVRGPAFETLADIVDACESRGGSVQSVEATTEATDVSVRLVVDHRIEATSTGTFTPEAAALTEAGELRVQFRAPSLAALVPSATPITAEQTTTVAVTDEGALRCTHEFTLDAVDADEGGAAAGASTESGDGTEPTEGTESPARTESTAHEGGRGDDLRAIRDESVPPYEDTPYLQALYESCDTFAEMSERIEMDVVAETVRRYMVDAGVHTPDSYETDAGETADPDAVGSSSPPEDLLVADGLGLPEDVGVADFVDAVAGATTVHEVSRALGVDQARTRELLRQLELLGEVVHRVVDEPRGLTPEEVRGHIHRHGSVGRT